MEEKDKVIITIQIPIEIYNQLKLKAKEDCSSVSYLVRKYMIKGLREDIE